jgi:hypothetical protein
VRSHFYPPLSDMYEHDEAKQTKVKKKKKCAGPTSIIVVRVAAELVM